MAFESEWDGFTALARSGIAEALYQAGVDSRIRDHLDHGDPCRADDADST